VGADRAELLGAVPGLERRSPQRQALSGRSRVRRRRPVPRRVRAQLLA
jgi:hypothetical protein